MALPAGGSVRRGGKSKSSNARAIAIGVCGVLALLALLSWFVPQRTATVLDTSAAKLDRGPASYFHHFYDPDGLLGPVGKIDLDLDTFQRETSHVILVAAFPSVPGNDPDFTMNVAERWRPGSKGADNGVILFVFTGERRIRAEVGYGLEGALPDAEIKRILEEAAVPAFRGGDFVAGLDAATTRIRERCRAVPAGGKPTRPTPLGAMKKGLGNATHALRTLGAILLAANFGQRMGASFIAVLLVGIAVVVIGDAARAVGTVVYVARREHDLEGAEKAGGAILNLVLKGSKVLIFVFLIALGGSYFFAGAGQFGGGGVDVLW
jgi:uncharacterized protein